MKPPRTVIDGLRADAAALEADLTRFVDEHSEIYRWHEPRFDSMVIFIGGEYAWKDLQTLGSRLQSDLLERERRLLAIIRTLLQGQPSEVQKEIQEREDALLAPIEQTKVNCLW